MSSTIDYSSIFTALLQFQSSLSQLSLALASGAGILIYANRITRKTTPILLSILGGSFAVFAILAGLLFTKRVMSNILTLDLNDSYYGYNTCIQIILMTFSGVCLVIAGYNTEAN